MTKTIYIEKQNESLINDFAEQNNLTVSKAINVLISQLETAKIDIDTSTPIKAKQSVKPQQIAQKAEIVATRSEISSKDLKAKKHFNKAFNELNERERIRFKKLM